MKKQTKLHFLLATVILSTGVLANTSTLHAESKIVPSDKSVCKNYDLTKDLGFPYTVGQLKDLMDFKAKELRQRFGNESINKVVVKTTDDADPDNEGLYTIELNGSFQTNRSHDPLLGIPKEATFYFDNGTIVNQVSYILCENEGYFKTPPKK